MDSQINNSVNDVQPSAPGASGTSTGKRNNTPLREKKLLAVLALVLSIITAALITTTVLLTYLAHWSVLWLAIVTLVLAIAALVLGVIALILNRKRKKGLSLTSLIVSGIMFVASIASLVVICMVPASQSEDSTELASSSSVSSAQSTKTPGDDKVGYVTLPQEVKKTSEVTLDTIQRISYKNNDITISMEYEDLRKDKSGKDAAKEIIDNKEAVERNSSPADKTQISRKTTTFTDKATGKKATCYQITIKNNLWIEEYRAIYIEGSKGVYTIKLMDYDETDTDTFNTYKKALDTWTSKKK